MEFDSCLSFLFIFDGSQRYEEKVFFAPTILSQKFQQKSAAYTRVFTVYGIRDQRPKKGWDQGPYISLHTRNRLIDSSEILPWDIGIPTAKSFGQSQMICSGRANYYA